MNLKPLIVLFLSIYMSGCSLLADDMFKDLTTDKSHKIATESIEMNIVAKADLDKKQLLVYVTAYKQAAASKDIRITGNDSLVLVFNDSEQKRLTLIEVPGVNRKYVYGIRLPLNKLNNTSFRLKFIRSKYQNTDTLFQLPANISFVSSEPSLTAGKLNLTRNYARSGSTKVYWQAGATPNPEDRFYFKSENKSCTIKENNQVLGTYKKLAPNSSVSSKEIDPYDINSSHLSGRLSWFKAKEKKYINIYTPPNKGRALLNNFISFKEKTEKIDFSRRADYLSIHCEGRLFLSSTASLNEDDIKNEKKDHNYQIKVDKHYHSSNIYVEKVISIPFFFNYNYIERNNRVDGRDGETAHLLFIRQ